MLVPQIQPRQQLQKHIPGRPIGSCLAGHSLQVRVDFWQAPAQLGQELSSNPGAQVPVIGVGRVEPGPVDEGAHCLEEARGHRFHPGDAARQVERRQRDERAEIRNVKIGFVFQSFNLLARTSALENVELPLIYSSNGVSAKDRVEKARRCLDNVGLAGREEHLPSQLSGGQQQRVAIARALINEPKLMLADEPTGNLDTKTSEEVMAVFQTLNDAGKTVVLITHERDIAEFARRVVVFRDGKVVEDRPVADQRRASGEAQRA